MSRAVTLTELIERVRQAADMEGSLFVTDGEITRYINTAVTEWFDMMVQNSSEEWGVYPVPTTLYVTASNYVYALPSACYKIRGVDRLVAGTSGSTNAVWESMERASFEDRNSRRGSQYDSYGNQWFGYRPLGGTTITFWPVPQENATLRVWFTPAVGSMTAGGDQLDGVNGYEEYVVLDAAIKCLLKEESDPSILMARKEQLRKRIEDASEERDQGQPDVIRDVRGGWWPYSWGDGFFNKNGF